MVLLWVAIVIVAILLSPFAYQRLVHHRSLKAGFVEYPILRLRHDLPLTTHKGGEHQNCQKTAAI